jgi:SLAP domain-containing protein
VAFLIVSATVLEIDVTTAQAADDYTVLYRSSEVEAVAADSELRVPFTVSQSGNVYTAVYISGDPVGYQSALYNSQGEIYDISNNPAYIYASDSYWVSEDGVSMNLDVWEMLPAGDYYYGVTFASDVIAALQIAQEQPEPKISETKATVTVGYTKKLSVTDGTVKTWTSSKKSVATVNSKGKVTGKKAGKATITAKLTDGKTLKCVVTVKANKYSASKLTTGDIYSGECAMSAYTASFDSKGNLVVKTVFVNKSGYKVSALENIKIQVKDANGKAIGTYTAKKKSMSVASGSTKSLSFTISKSKLKQKKADLRNATIKCSGTYVYYY